MLGFSLGFEGVGMEFKLQMTEAIPFLFSVTNRASSSSLPTSIPIAMETTNGTETWYKSLHAVLKALNATIHNGAGRMNR